MFILKSKLTRQQEAVAVLDFTNPYAQGFTSFLYANDGQFINAVSGSDLKNPTNTDVITALSIQGKHLAFNGNTSNVNYGDVNSVNFGGAYSFFILFRPNAQTGSRREMLIAKDESSGRQFTVELNPNGISGALNGQTASIGHSRFVTNTTYYQKISAANVVNNGKWHSLLIGSTDGKNDITAFLDGRVLDLYAGTQSITGLMQNTTTACLVGKRTYSGFNDYFSGDIAIIGISNKAPTLDLARLLFNNPFDIILNRGLIIPTVTAGPGSQTLTHSTLVSSPTFYSPTVTPGAVILTPSTLISSPTFYAPTVTPGTVTLTPATLVNDPTFYSHTVSLGAGPQTLTTTTLVSAPTFYSPTVSPGTVTLTPTTLVNSPTFYNPTVSLGASPQTLTTSTLVSSPTFYAPTVTPGAVTLTPSTLVSAPTFYSHTVSLGSSPQTLLQSTLVNAPTFYSHTVTAGSVTLTPSTLINIPSFYNPTVYIPAGQSSISRTFTVIPEDRTYYVQPESRGFLI